jgi:hypothetical protein
VREEKELASGKIQAAINRDPIVIALRERIKHVRVMMGEDYASRVKLELDDYIRINYRDA